MAYTDIDDPTAYFQTKLYTEAGSFTFDGNSDLAPNWMWIKERNGTNEHNLFDSVRGTTKRLESSTTAAEQTSSTTLTAFGSDGFTVGNNPGTGQNGGNYVGWGWKAGTSFTNDASGTGIGSIDSAGSVNQDAGFSIVSYTNTNQTANSGVATIKHGLNKIPSVMILKDRDAASDWSMYHSSLNNNQYLLLHDDVAAATDANIWNNTAPTSTVFTVGDNSYSNPSDRKMIAYCFAEKQGYSKFGSYVGNGNADGPFIYTGFKPAFIIRKRSDGAVDWRMDDNKRRSFNAIDFTLFPNKSNAETQSAGYAVDLLSNGFKVRGDSGNQNTNGGTYIYMAFAEQPLVTSTGVPATAK